MITSGKLIRWLVGISVLGLLALNIIAYNHAYRFTHFSDTVKERTEASEIVSSSSKISLLLKGVDNPRPVNKRLPECAYETIYLDGRETLEGWLISSKEERGVVLLFHGYTGEKSDLLEVAEKFRELGYHTLLFDFPGSGGSGGMNTTVGYYEAEDVQFAFGYAQERFSQMPIVLYGFSLGGVAVMRAVSDYAIQPAGAIVEAPFGTMINSVENRFEALKIPAFPFAQLLAFWGGIQHDFWAFSHNPIDYAKQIDTPVLLTFGLKDDRVDKWEIEKIYDNLAGSKEYKYFDRAGHELYIYQYPEEWFEAVDNFLHEI